MRAFLSVAFGLGITTSLVLVIAAGCSAGVAAPTGEGGTSDGSLEDGPHADATFMDGASCGAIGGTYDKKCSTAADCATVSRGCYCGATPVLGIAKTAAAAAQACE